MSGTLVGWLRESFNLNHLKCPEIPKKIEVSNINFQHK